MVELFNEPSFRALKKGLDYADQQQRRISSNIANIETPGYRGSRLDFADALREAVSQKSGIPIARTDPRHLPKTQAALEPRVLRLRELSVDKEMAELAKNTIFYDTYVEILNRKNDLLNVVIR